MTEQHGSPDSAALQKVARYLQEADEALSRAGAAAAYRRGIVEDLRAQIHEMLGTGEPTPEQVEMVLAQLEPPEAYAEAFLRDTPREAPDHPARRSAPSSGGMFFQSPVRPDVAGSVWIGILGVAVPLGVLVFELLTRYCTRTLFDPIPTIWHKLGVAFVAGANAQALYCLRTGRLSWPRTVFFFNSVAASISIAYALLFLPLYPAAVIAIAIFGVGLLPLTPLFALWGSLLARRCLKQTFEQESLRFPGHFLCGVLAVVGAVALLNAREQLTLQAVRWAVAADAPTQARGLSWLRAFGDEDALLNTCYGNTGRRRFGAAWQTESTVAVPPETARQVYYRMTGRAYNSVPPPHANQTQLGDAFDWMEIDPRNRDESVGWQDTRLELAGSRMDGIIDYAAGVGYVEWTLTFHNQASWAREARAQMLLPPDGVVSRLTLWVNGEEREAAFAPRATVKKAYEDVVTRTPRRDPVLVTTCGDDRVFIQCFPVPAGGWLKTRVGITFPLGLLSASDAEFTLPAFHDRNFAVASEPLHKVWIEFHGAGTVSDSAPLKAEPGTTGTARLTGALDDAALCARPYCRVARVGAPAQAAFADARTTHGAVIRQRVSELPIARPARVVVVVDGSARMAANAEALAEALSAIPDGVQAAVVFASDAVYEKPQLRACDDALRGHWAEAVRDWPWAGGQDNVPALEEALALLGDGSDGLLLWIHAPQPVIIRPPDGLLQRAERGAAPPHICELQVAAGRDAIVPEWSRVCTIDSVPRRGSLRDDVRAFLALHDGKHTRFEYRLDRAAPAAGETATSGTRAAGHVCRLWAAREAARLAALRDASARQQAMSLASLYQLVTPLTGAVVLETKQMFDAAGLTPVDATTVPTIPEPETWVLIVIALLAFAVVARRMRARTARVA